MTCYGNLRPKSPPLTSENLSLYFASLINRSMSSFVDTTMEGIPSSFISSICFNFRECHSHICISFAVAKSSSDKSNFPQSQSAQLQQRLSNEEDEQPLSVDL